MFSTPRAIFGAYAKKSAKVRGVENALNIDKLSSLRNISNISKISNAKRVLTVSELSNNKIFERASSNLQFQTEASSESHIVESSLPQIEIPNVLLHDYVWRGLDKWHDRTALECIETGRKYKFSEVYIKSRALAVFLRKNLELQAGDCVAFVLRNVPEYAIGMMAAFQAGLTATTINPIYTSEEIKRQLIDSKAKVVFTLGDIYPAVNQAIRLIPSAKIHTAIIKHLKDESMPAGTIKFDEMCEGDHKELTWDPPKLDDVAILPFSSGTTGMPKGVQLTHRSVVANLSQWLNPGIDIIRQTDSSHQDVIPCFLPMFHIYGIMVIFLSCFSMGSKMITVPKFGSEIFIKLLTHYPPDVLFAVPPIILMLLNNPYINLGHIQHIRTVVSSAAPLGAADIERFVDKSKGAVQFLQIYGMTEASPLILCQTKNCHGGIKIGGSGMLLPNSKAKIVDVDDATNTGLGARKSGELIIKGPQIMKGYLNNPEATSLAIVDDGWLRTGDIAHFDEDGQYYITDRLKELIKVKGFQVAPAELEEILRDHPAIADAAVIGVSHPGFGEVPKAFVVLKKDASVNIDNILEYVSSKVAKYKQLTGGVVFMETIPKNPAGKILRRELKAM